MQGPPKAGPVTSVETPYMASPPFLHAMRGGNAGNGTESYAGGDIPTVYVAERGGRHDDGCELDPERRDAPVFVGAQGLRPPVPRRNPLGGNPLGIPALLSRR